MTMSSGSVTLFNGEKMPLVGLGTWQATQDKELETALDMALGLGYRHIDTAYMYKNEGIIGRVLKRWLDSGKVRREELFIVTKLPPFGMRREHVGLFLERQLRRLQLEYVDLYLLHVPVGLQYRNGGNTGPKENGKPLLDLTTDHVDIWKAMEEQVDRGRVKSIGLSNFSSSQIERIIQAAKIQPANIQVELHPYCQQKPLRQTCNKYNITVCAYAPFGSPGRKEIIKQLSGDDWEPTPILDDAVILQIAQAHGKSAAQVLLRFLIQQGIAVIPKSTNSDRIKGNFDVFDFTLTESEMTALEALDRGADGRTFDLSKLIPGASAHPEYVTTYG